MIVRGMQENQIEAIIRERLRDLFMLGELFIVSQEFKGRRVIGAVDIYSHNIFSHRSQNLLVSLLDWVYQNRGWDERIVGEQFS